MSGALIRWIRDRRVPAGAALLALAAGFFALRTESKPAARQTQDPSSERIEYRPGAYFPEGFPLHGKVRLLTNPVVEAGKRERIRIEYTVGDVPVEAGMAIEIWKHFTSDVEEFQVDDPDAPAWFGAEVTAAGVKVKRVKFTNWVQRNSPAVFPYRKCVALVVEEGRLKEGDKILFDLGGPKGVRMQQYAENLFNFRVAITKEGLPVAYGGDAMMTVTGGPLAKLRVQAPSVVNVGERFTVEIVPTDAWVSLAKNHTGLSFRVTSTGLAPGAFHYDEKLQHYIARDFVAHKEGTFRITVQTADGRYKGVSNPIWVIKNPVWRVYYGEMHQHTYLADGRGVFRELYLNARRVGLLDFAALSPHHIPLSLSGPILRLKDEQWPTDQWPELQRVTKVMNGWEGLVSILGYEYSVGTRLGGHHNVYFKADEAKSTMELDTKDPRAPIGKMLRTLRFAKVPTLVIPHIGGGPPDWTHPPDPRIERLFEVASVHGVFEESWRKHLEAGLRQGVIGAGDTHTVSMGIAYPGLIYTMTNALAGVYAYGKNREDIWNGMYQRRTFAATGNQRILVRFEVNGELMGGEISSKLNENARVHARISGTAPLVSVELVKNNNVIHQVKPARRGARLLRVTWGDNIYQRRAAVGRAPGRLEITAGRLKLVRVVHRDQAFEWIRQEGERAIVWNTAAPSDDRDGVLLDISEAEGELRFHADDPPAFGAIDFTVPLAVLERDGFYVQRIPSAKVKHSYMKKMGLEPAYRVEFELVNPDAPMDLEFDYEDREPLEPGDFYYLRVEQLDTNKAWSSPVWVN